MPLSVHGFPNLTGKILFFPLSCCTARVETVSALTLHSLYCTSVLCDSTINMGFPRRPHFRPSFVGAAVAVAAPDQHIFARDVAAVDLVGLCFPVRSSSTPSPFRASAGGHRRAHLVPRLSEPRTPVEAHLDQMMTIESKKIIAFPLSSINLFL